MFPKEKFNIGNKEEKKDLKSQSEGFLSGQENEKVEILSAKENDIEGILKIQQEHLLKNVSTDTEKKDGFLLFETAAETLKEIIEEEKIIISKVDDDLAGYLILMTPEKLKKSDFYALFLENIKNFKYKDKQLDNYNYIVYAQAAVSKKYQGMGLNRKMQKEAKERFINYYDLGIGEINTKNEASLKVNIDRLGWKPVGIYKDPKGEEWCVTIDDFKEEKEKEKKE